MRRLSTLLAFTLIVLGSSSPSVKILGSWTSPSMSTAGYEDIFVTALTENILARQTVEQDLDNLLNEKGVQAQSSFTILPPGFKSSGVDKNEVLQKLKLWEMTLF